MPDLNPAAERQKGEHAREAHRGYLGGDHDVLAVVAIGYGSAHGREEEDGNAVGESYDAEEHG
jgi:hypothetical protein